MRNSQPTRGAVQGAIRHFDEDSRYGTADRALGELLQRFPDNRHIEYVLLKCVALNALYHTNIYAAVPLAQTIVAARLDKYLRKGSDKAVGLIAELTAGTKTRSTYSFATKYCSWHQPELFPIYDGRVGQALRCFSNRDGFASFRDAELRQYPRFRAIIDEFRTFYSLDEFSYKQIDKYLWWFGNCLRKNDG